VRPSGAPRLFFGAIGGANATASHRAAWQSLRVLRLAKAEHHELAVIAAQGVLSGVLVEPTLNLYTISRRL
jgi:hypothetical protein